MDEMTIPQSNFIAKLNGERDVPVAGKTAAEATIISRFEDALGGGKFVSKREASQVIDWLKNLPMKPLETATKTQPEVGVYVLPDGTIVKAQPNKAKTNVYTLRWITIGGERLVDATEDRVHGEWEYAPELKREIKPEFKMTLEQAKDFILRYGQCARCSRKLKAAESVERGIGPVCKNYFSFAA